MNDEFIDYLNIIGNKFNPYKFDNLCKNEDFLSNQLDILYNLKYNVSNSQDPTDNDINHLNNDIFYFTKQVDESTIDNIIRNKITKVSFHNTKINETILNILLKKTNNIEYLDLSNNILNFKKLADVLIDNKTIKDLSLNGSHINSEQLIYLIYILNSNNSIENINFENCDMITSNFIILNNFIKQINNLSKLNLNLISTEENYDICKNFMKLLFVNLNGNTTLKDLSLQENQLDDNDAELISIMLEINNTLEKLDLSYNKFTKTGICKILNAIINNDNSGIKKINFVSEEYYIELEEESSTKLKDTLVDYYEDFMEQVMSN